jgi:hypothetical protein
LLTFFFSELTEHNVLKVLKVKVVCCGFHFLFEETTKGKGGKEALVPLLPLSSMHSTLAWKEKNSFVYSQQLPSPPQTLAFRFFFVCLFVVVFNGAEKSGQAAETFSC